MGARRPYSLESPLSVDEARAALKREVDPYSLRTPTGVGGASLVLGRIGDTQVVLFGRQAGRNTWSWTFRGTIKPSSGAQLSGTVGAPRGSMVFAAVWCLLCVAFFVPLLVAALVAVADHGATGVHLLGVLGAFVPLGFLAAYVGLASVATKDAARRWGDVDALLQGWLEVDRRA
jgi:hypothetical protein